MSGSRVGLVLDVVAVLLLGTSLVFAVTRYTSMSESHDELVEYREKLQQAKKIAATLPASELPSKNPGTGERDLKPLVQQKSTQYALTLVFMTDSEKVLNKGTFERNILSRIVNVNHDKLVQFLADLESSSNARIKELRIHPTKTSGDLYSDVEFILTQRGTVDTSPANPLGKSEGAP